LQVNTTKTAKKPKNSLKERLDIYNYDNQMKSTWKLITADIPESIQLYEKCCNVLVSAAMSKTLRNNNLKALLSLGRIAKKKEISWNSITRDQVN